MGTILQNNLNSSFIFCNHLKNLNGADRVLEPLVPTEGRPEDFVDIKAGDVLKKNIYDLGNFSISRYAKKVKDIGFNRFPDLNKYSQSTFFIPVDSAFEVSFF